MRRLGLGKGVRNSVWEDWCSTIIASKGERGEKGILGVEGGCINLLLLGSLTPALALGVRVCQFPIGYVSYDVWRGAVWFNSIYYTDCVLHLYYMILWKRPSLLTATAVVYGAKSES